MLKKINFIVLNIIFLTLFALSLTHAIRYHPFGSPYDIQLTTKQSNVNHKLSPSFPKKIINEVNTYLTGKNKSFLSIHTIKQAAINLHEKSLQAFSKLIHKTIAHTSKTRGLFKMCLYGSLFICVMLLHGWLGRYNRSTKTHGFVQKYLLYVSGLLVAMLFFYPASDDFARYLFEGMANFYSINPYSVSPLEFTRIHPTHFKITEHLPINHEEYTAIYGATYLWISHLFFGLAKMDCRGQ